MRDRPAIEAGQRVALGALLDALVPNNRFYTRKLETARVGEISSLDQFFARVPFTTKQELVEDQRACPPYGTNLTYPLDRYARFSQTSGTSGAPLRWLDTAAKLGCLCLPGGGLSSAARLRAILDNEVTVLCCTPTYALRLAEVAAQEGL